MSTLTNTAAKTTRTAATTAARPMFEAMESRQMMSVAAGVDTLTSADVREAMSLGTLDRKDRARDNRVSPNDPADYFSFTVKRDAKVQVKLANMTADADLKVFNRNGTVIGESRNAGSANESVTHDDCRHLLRPRQ